MLRTARRIFLGLAVCFSLLFATVTFTPALGPWTRALTAPWSETSDGTLVVLAGDATSDHVLGLTSYWRAVYAVFEWRRGRYGSILFSGGEGIPEAMRDFAVAQGVPANAIALDTHSLTTRESALNAATLLRNSPAPWVLITSDYHSRRAWLAFRKAGVNVGTHPAPDAGKRMTSLSARWPVFIDLTRETVKYAWYWLRGWI
jgi:uncharacterized SAM-binding protein YcdF (DUF218 family)